MASSIMGSSKDKENSILQQGIIILASLDLIRRKEEEYILGQEKKVMFTKENSKLEREMVEALSGGQMVAGIKGISEMEFKADGEFFIEKEGTENTKVTGTTECSMVKAHNTFRMAKDMKALSNKTSSMEKAFSIKMTQSFTEFGRTMNYLW